jgi:uncharacterized membrane protein
MEHGEGARLTDVWYHMIGNLLAVALALVNFLLRYAEGAQAAVKPWGLTLSLVVVGMLLFTGWKGLSFHWGRQRARRGLQALPI